MDKILNELRTAKNLFGGETTTTFEFENDFLFMELLNKNELSSYAILNLLVDHLTDLEEDADEPVRPSELIKYIQDVTQLKNEVFE